MKRWEYKIVVSRDLKRMDLFGGSERGEIQEYLNHLGAEGREIVNQDFYELEGRGSFMGLAKREVD